MTTTRLMRWSGPALLLAGVLILAGGLLHPSAADPRAFARPAWLLAHAILIVSLFLAQPGFTGLYTRQAERAGALGLIGFVLITIGSMLTTAALTVDAFVFPALLASPGAAALADPAGPLLGGPLGLVLLGATATFSLGAIMLGAATIRARVFAAWPALLLAVGGPLLAAGDLLPAPLGPVGAVLLGLGCVWFGIQLFTHTPAASVAPAVAPLRSS